MIDASLAGGRPRRLPLWQRRHGLPRHIAAFAWRSTGVHQIALVGLAAVVFLMTTAPLELQRRIVNQVLAKVGGALDTYETVILLCGAYVAVSVFAGLIKLGFNIYRSWVGEMTVRLLRAVVYERAALRRGGASDDATGEGVSLSVVLAEVEPVGGFVGTILSEPLLQAGILASVFGYMTLLQPWIALLAFVLFLPQLVFIPVMQRAINLRAARRIRTIREVGVQMIDDWSIDARKWHTARYHDHIGSVFGLNMQIFSLKFSLSYLMNLIHHMGIVGVLLVGGWYVFDRQIEVGTIVAFLSGLASINDPWRDLVEYYREMSVARVKYALIEDAFGDESMRNAQTPIDVASPA